MPTTCRCSKLIVREGRSATIELPCRNHKSRVLKVTLTKQVAKPGGDMPVKRCIGCRKSVNVIAFLKTGRARRDGYYELEDSAFCHQCLNPEQVRIHKDRLGKLRMALRLRDETGAPVRAWDRSTRHWITPETLGLRLMPSGNELRLQPYTNRSASRRAS